MHGYKVLYVVPFVFYTIGIMRIIRDYTYTVWQVGALKFAMLSMGVAIGAYWQEIFLPYAIWLFGVGLALGVYMAYISFSDEA